ncbi:unnamed protein product [Meloidogyne enterolobii]|uniref:Uncharacterized protein n=1 Tax=Meloidogyne enterolobii TaxID=390850 RepID=A0ACB0XV30_MELEN
MRFLSVDTCNENIELAKHVHADVLVVCQRHEGILRLLQDQFPGPILHQLQQLHVWFLAKFLLVAT